MSDSQNNDALESVEPKAPGSETAVRQVGVRQGAFRVQGSGDTSGFGGLVKPIGLPTSTARPFGQYFDDIADQLEKSLTRSGISPESAIDYYNVYAGQFTISVQREQLLAVAKLLRDEPALRFEMCTSVNGVHWPQDEGRELHSEYQLLSMTHNRRVSLKVTCPDADPHMPSVTSVWPGTNWHERETYDFFGIIYDGHPALTRIAMPDDWAGHPQRKDYPLGGIGVEFKGVSVPAPSLRRSY